MKRPLALILTFVFIDVLGFSLILPLQPYYADDFNASSVVVGLLLAANALTQMIGSFLLAEISPVAPGITGAILMVGVAVYTCWHRILFIPDLECEEYE